jgi:membrane AbrB-like protein
LSGFTHLIGWVTVAPPTLFVITAQIVMGTVIGSRFVGSTLREVARDLGLAAIATALMLAAGFGLAVFIAWLVDMPIAQIYLAFAPGGLTEMSLLTLAIDQDVAFVSVAHLVRIAVVIAAAPIVFRLLGIGRFTKTAGLD